VKSSRTTAPRKTAAAPRKAPARARSRARMLPLRYAPAALVAIVVVLGWTLYPVVRLSYRQQRESAKLEQQLANIEKRNEQLRQEVARLQTPAGVEDVARERLGLVKKGEHMYVVMPFGAASASVAPLAALRTADMSGSETFVQRVLDAVFGVGP
jgi:cell division protein FtsL